MAKFVLRLRAPALKRPKQEMLLLCAWCGEQKSILRAQGAAPQYCSNDCRAEKIAFDRAMRAQRQRFARAGEQCQIDIAAEARRYRASLRALAEEI